MRSIGLSMVLFILTLGLLSGCVSMQGQPQIAQSLEPSGTLRFEDVPVPAGFKILPQKSFILESGGVRAGVLRYTGKANAESVVDFYKNQMAIYNWALLNVLEYGERMLNFERENEGCVIAIEPRGGRVNISVSLAPKAPMSVPEKKIENRQLPRVEKIK